MAGQTSAGREKAALYFQETNNGAHYTGDLVFALNNDSGSAVQVSTSDERLRITSSGNVGIGLTNPSTKLHLSSGTATQIMISNISSTMSDGDTIGTIDFAAGPSNTVNARVAGAVEGTSEAGGDLVFETRADGGSLTEKLLITSSGNIRYTYSDSSTTTSSQVPPGLRINNTDNTLGRLAGIHFAHGGGGTANAGIFHVTTNTDTPSTTCLGDLAFYMKASGSSTMTERMRLDSSGRLLVGMTSSAGAGCNVQIREDGFGRHLELLRSYDSAATPARLWFSASRGSEGSPTIQQSGDMVGELRFNSYDGVDYNSQVATIRAHVDGTPGENDTPGRLVFLTTADGAASPTERMRIDNVGNVYLKVMQVGGTANVHWSSTAGQLFVTSSSERFKHDIVDYDKGLDELMQMQPKYFVYNDEPNQKQRAGFIAEDFHVLGLTEYVEYWNDDEGNATVPSEIGYANMVAILVKGIQEQQAMITELQTKVAALEAQNADLLTRVSALEG